MTSPFNSLENFRDNYIHHPSRGYFFCRGAFFWLGGNLFLYLNWYTHRNINKLFFARSFRESLAKRFLTLQKIHQMEDEMSKKQEFLALVAIRLFTTPIMDFSSYIAGLTKISFKKFLLATIIASLPTLAIFNFGEEVYKRVFARNLAIGVTCLFFIALFYYIFHKCRKRN